MFTSLVLNSKQSLTGTDRSNTKLIIAAVADIVLIAGGLFGVGIYGSMHGFDPTLSHVAIGLGSGYLLATITILAGRSLCLRTSHTEDERMDNQRKVQQ